MRMPLALPCGVCPGGVRQLYDASGQVVGSSRYDPFGSVMSQSGATSVFAFAGEQYDAATGLEYLRARYYSSAQGRFTTRDVWEGDPNAPMSYNAWNYTNGNPVNYADPTGRCRDCSKLGPIARAILTWLGQCLPTAPESTETETPTPKVAHVVPPTGTPTLPPTPSPTPVLSWLDGDFTINHYTFALESDPIYANDASVSARGLPEAEKYREGFLFGARGILMQGTGLAESGQYITIDWSHGDPQGRETYFRHGIGGRYSNPVEWETVATGDNRLQRGTRIRIAIYPDRVFTVADTGQDIGQGRIDVFVGAITIAEADQLGRRTSKVAIVR